MTAGTDSVTQNICMGSEREEPCENEEFHRMLQLSCYSSPVPPLKSSHSPLCFLSLGNLEGVVGIW